MRLENNNTECVPGVEFALGEFERHEDLAVHEEQGMPRLLGPAPMTYIENLYSGWEPGGTIGVLAPPLPVPHRYSA